MRLQIIHLSDMHFEKREDSFEIRIDKMIQAINTLDNADECIIVISGDLAMKGVSTQYKVVSSLIGALFRELSCKKYKGKKIEFVCVPGNHDIDFSKFEITFDMIKEAYKMGKIEDVVNTYISNMGGFFGFARYRKCFIEDAVVSKKVMKYENKRIAFVLLNTAPLSLLGGNSEDMGSHYLSDNHIKKLDQAAEADINVLVMHHSIEWFSSLCKDKLKKIISRRYSLVITGHEHLPIGESRNFNRNGDVQYVQGNALYGYATEGNGFCVINIDMEQDRVVGHSIIWKNDIYVPKKILDGVTKRSYGTNLIIKNMFLEEISLDNDKKKIDDYYVFPSFSYNVYKENEEVEKHDVEIESELDELITKHNKIIITGEQKAGKTVLARKLFRIFLEKGKTPLLISASEINKKRIEKTIEYTFAEQYESDDNGFAKFEQINKSDKIALLDEANLLQIKTLKILLEFLELNFGKVIVFTEEKLDLDIKKQVVNIMVNSDTLNLTMKPFLYVKRKRLISNVLEANNSQNRDIESETKRINELINSQVKFFQLNPEFIINFVNQYEKDFRFRFSTGMNVFNVVYESSIRNRIIDNSENIDVTLVINVLRELAFYMHFEKKSAVSIDEITSVIEQYQKAYRQKVNIRMFLNTAINAKILVDMGNEIRFRDHTLLAYFVAQALNQKHHQEENIQDNLDYLLKNLCFSINSDIVLFLALITNNPKFVNVIIEGAKEHFAQQEELSFDAENVKFLLDASVPVKNSLPSEEERRKRDEMLAKQEEEVYFSDLIELVNEYDYSEEDLLKIENQVMISFKYLEILSKTLPAFCQNMKVEQQDILVSLIYKCPNQFLFKILNDINEDFESFCTDIYQDISALRQEKQIVDTNIDSVKHMIKQISAVLVMALYQVVAFTCTSEQTIAALNDFDFNKNSNYKLQNLMMISRIIDVGYFSKRAQELNQELDNKIEKSIIKYTVREYLLRNNVEVYGDAQSLIDCFFSGQATKKLKMEMAKNRITEKDRT